MVCCCSSCAFAMEISKFPSGRCVAQAGMRGWQQRLAGASWFSAGDPVFKNASWSSQVRGSDAPPLPSPSSFALHARAHAQLLLRRKLPARLPDVRERHLLPRPPRPVLRVRTDRVAVCRQISDLRPLRTTHRSSVRTDRRHGSAGERGGELCANVCRDKAPFAARGAGGWCAAPRVPTFGASRGSRRRMAETAWCPFSARFVLRYAHRDGAQCRPFPSRSLPDPPQS